MVSSISAKSSNRKIKKQGQMNDPAMVGYPLMLYEDWPAISTDMVILMLIGISIGASLL